MPGLPQRHLLHGLCPPSWQEDSASVAGDSGQIQDEADPPHPAPGLAVRSLGPASSLTVPGDRKPLLLGERERGPFVSRNEVSARATYHPETPQSHFPFFSAHDTMGNLCVASGGPIHGREIDQ